MVRPHDPGTDTKEDGPAGSSDGRPHRERLVVRGGRGRDLPVTAEILRRYGAAGTVRARRLDDLDIRPGPGELATFRAVAVILQPDAASDPVALLERVSALLDVLPGGAPHAGGRWEDQTVVVAGLPALVRHRWIRSGLARTGGVALTAGGLAVPDGDVDTPAGPPATERLAGVLAEWGVRDVGDVVALARVFRDGVGHPSLLEKLRRAVPDLRPPGRADDDPRLDGDLVVLRTAVDVAVALHRTSPPDDVPVYRTRQVRHRR